MEGPRALLRRAWENRMAAPVRPATPEEEPPREPPREHHGDYAALMRSHDRLRTRHLPVQGRRNRA